MRREKLFSNQGFYPFIVESNVLLHREAIEQGCLMFERLLKQRAPERPVRVLDLACGGEPVVMASIMESFLVGLSRYYLRFICGSGYAVIEHASIFKNNHLCCHFADINPRNLHLIFPLSLILLCFSKLIFGPLKSQ